MTDRISGGKAKLTTSGAKQTKFADETNHTGLHLLPAETAVDGWVPTLAPLTLLNIQQRVKPWTSFGVLGHIFYHRHFRMLSTEIQPWKSSHMMASSQWVLSFLPL